MPYVSREGDLFCDACGAAGTHRHKPTERVACNLCERIRDEFASTYLPGATNTHNKKVVKHV